MAERMGPLDTFFVLTEDDGVNHMHVGGFATVRGDAPTHEQMLAHVAGKLPLIPRYRQVMLTVPLQIARPVWADAQDFDLSRHVRSAVLPAPTRDALRAVLADLISERLDRSRPLWELWIISDVGPDEWVVAWKIHHCMIDGVSGTELLTVLFDAGPEPALSVRDDWRPAPAPTPAELVRDAVTDFARDGVDHLTSLVGAVWDSRATMGTITRLARDGVRLGARMSRPDLSSPLNGRVGTLRSFDWTSIPFADVTAVRRAFGGTINDVVLAAVLAGYRDLFLARGRSVTGRTMRVLVPVALRGRDASGQALGDGTMMTKASGLVADLPLDVADPVERLAQVRAHIDRLKGSSESAAMDAGNELSGLAPPALLAVGLRLFSRMPQRSVGPVVTNVPGPRETLYLLGGEITHIWSYAPPFPVGARTSVGVYSYAGELHVGVTGDRDSVPDVDVIVAGIRQGADDLLAAVTD